MHGRLRGWWAGLATALGLSARGFFIPYRYASQVAAPGRDAYPAVGALLRQRLDAFREVLAAIERYADDLLAITGGRAPAPRWDQDWFPRLDAAAAYALVRARAPGRIIEIGSGHSSRFLARAVADQGLETAITAIDPAPRANLAGLALRRIYSTLQAAGPDAFAEVRPGDFVIVDSSHVLVPGSDVDLLLNCILPALPAGAVVHFHDVFLPDGYPRAWAWRGYNEQLGLAPLVLGGAFEVLFASHFVATRLDEEVRRTVVGRLPLEADARESSLWLRKLRA